ncbi:hypothetical protein [Sinorhizobium meliloti]|nr:hypothetical protein [Sinorhizobium meliloti]
MAPADTDGAQIGGGRDALITDAMVKAAKDAYGEAFIAAGFKGYIADDWMRAALKAALSAEEPRA